MTESSLCFIFRFHFTHSVCVCVRVGVCVSEYVSLAPEQWLIINILFLQAWWNPLGQKHCYSHTFTCLMYASTQAKSTTNTGLTHAKPHGNINYRVYISALHTQSNLRLQWLSSLFWTWGPKGQQRVQAWAIFFVCILCWQSYLMCENACVCAWSEIAI